MQQQSRTRRIIMVTAATAMLTAGGTGLAFAYDDPGPKPAETGYLVVEGGAAQDDCADHAGPDAATLTFTAENGL